MSLNLVINFVSLLQLKEARQLDTAHLEMPTLTFISSRDSPLVKFEVKA